MRIGVYGANGYQGKLVAEELARQDIDFVLIGRSFERLREAAATVGLTDADVRLAPADDHEALVRALVGCGAVINCAGPFTLSGRSIVAAAIAAGSHYLDTSGEQLYVKDVFDTFEGAARRAGVSIIPAMNDDNLPASLVASLTAAEVEPVDEITIAVKLTGEAASRGSLRSALETLEVLRNGGVVYDEGEWRSGGSGSPASMRFPGDDEDTPVVRFPLPPVVTVPRHVDARHVHGVAAAALLAGFGALTPDLIDSLPAGPSEAQRRADGFTVVVDAVGLDGRSARGVVSGSDTYGTTAVIAVAGARELATVGASAGVLAPAQAYDPRQFLDDLKDHGVQWAVETTTAAR